MVYNKNRKNSRTAFSRPDRKQIGAKFAEPDFGSDSDLNFEFERPNVPEEEKMPLNDIQDPLNLPQAKAKPQDQQIRFDNKENKKAFFQNRKSREPSPNDLQFKEIEKKNKKNQKAKKKGTVAKPNELKK